MTAHPTSAHTADSELDFATSFPVTLAQEGIVGLEVLHPASAAGITAERLTVEHRLDPAAVAAALNRIHRRHHAIRIRLNLDGREPAQEVLAPNAADLTIIEVDNPVAVQAAIDEAVTTPLEVQRGHTTRAVLINEPERSHFVHCAHHLVLDGFGAGLLLREFGSHYDQVRTGHHEPSDYPDPPTVAQMVADDQARRAHRDHLQARAQWMRLRSELPPVAYPVDRTITAGVVPQRAAVTLSDDVHRQLGQLRREMSIGWQNLLVTVLGGLASTRPETDPVAVGVPVANRTGSGKVLGAHAPCTAVTILPVLVPDGASTTLRQACADVARWEAAASRSYGVTQEHLLALDRAEDVTRIPSAQINVMPFAQRIAIDGERVEVTNVRIGPVPGWTLTIRGGWANGDRVRIEADVNPAAHPDLDPQDLAERALHRLTVAAAGGGELTMRELPRCSPVEQQWHTGALARNPHPLLAATLYDSFARAAQEHPARIALDDGHTQLSVAELWEQSRHVARELAERGVRRGDVVGIHLDRSVAQVVAVHALLHVGAAYLPLHRDLPAQRRQQMCADANTRLVVDDELLAELTTQPSTGQATDLDETWEPTPAGLDELAYVLYTSGSTGQPKGVQITHRAIDNRVQWMQHQCRLTPGETVLYKTPCSFDVHIWELYWPHQHGARARVAGEGVERDPHALADLMTTDGGVDIVHFVPSMLHALLATPTARRTLAGGPAPREIVCSGEALGRALVDQVHAVTGTWPLNLYGPTEAAVDVTYHRCRRENPDHDVPLGRPVWNTRCYVLDDAGRPVPDGTIGTLWLGGVQLSTGYIGRPDLNRTAFRYSPALGRIYDTGDLVERDSSGELYYRGRRDSQVKIRGQRIELGEVETILRAIPGIRDAVCHIEGDQLTAHLLTDRELSITTVRDTVAAKATGAMVPARWATHDTFPTTTNGKTDRAALAASPAHYLHAGTDAGSSLAPTNTSHAPRDVSDSADNDPVLREAVRSAFSAVLGRPCTVDQGFFELGGNSLGCVRLVGEIERRTGRAPTVRDVMAAPTPRRLASLIGVGGHTDTAIVTLAAGTGDAAQGQPTVLLPPAGGLCWSYLPIVSELAASGPVLAVHAPWVDDPEWSASTLDELCRWYSTKMSEHFGQRPIRLAGWSVGGTCAQAIAAGGELAVSAIGLLDAYPAEQWATRPAPGPVEQLAALARMGGVDENTLDCPLTDRDSLVAVLTQRQSPLAVLGPETIEACLSGVELSTRLLRAHRTTPWSGPAVHIGASASAADGLDAAGWAPYVGSLTTVHISGNHVAVVNADHAPTVAGALTQPALTDAVNDRH